MNTLLTCSTVLDAIPVGLEGSSIFRSRLQGGERRSVNSVRYHPPTAQGVSSVEG